MTRKALVNVLLVVALVLVFGVSLAIGGRNPNPDERFLGTDSAATSTILEVEPGYEPWFHPFFQPGSGEVESGLFALQAGIGGAVLGFAVGALWGRHRTRPTASAPGAAPEPAA